MIKFDYYNIARLEKGFLELGGCIVVIFSTGVGILLMAVSVQVNPPYWGAGCFVIWIFLIGWLVGFTMLNFYPTIWIDEQSIYISAFLFMRIAIPWIEVTNLRFAKGMAGSLGNILVSARHLTPFHRIYGWMYARTLAPSFLIGQNIQDHDKLLREIRIRANIIV